MVKCVSCNGVYTPVQADGTRYFHVCPPLVTYVDGAGHLLTPQQIDDAFKGDKPPARVDVRRPQHRDENIDPAKAKAAIETSGKPRDGVGDDTVVKSPGAGTVPVNGL